MVTRTNARRLPRRSRRTLAACLAVASALPLAAARPARAEVIDRVVAIIEEEAIFLSDVERRVRPVLAQFERIPDAEERDRRRSELIRDMLRRMIDESLIRRAATRAHAAVTPEEVDRMLEGVARQHNTTVPELMAAIESEGMTRAEYRTFIENEVLRLKLMNIRVRGRVNINEREITEEYRRMVREAIAHSPFHAAHIFVAFPANPTAAQIVAAQQRALELSRRAAAGEAFADLARQYSDDQATRNAGGDLGTLDPADDEVAPPAWLVNAVRDLQPGQTSAPVRGENGYHVFRLTGRDTPNIPPLTEVRQQVFNALVEREMGREMEIYLRELRQRSLVEDRLEPGRNSAGAAAGEIRP